MRRRQACLARGGRTRCLPLFAYKVTRLCTIQRRQKPTTHETNTNLKLTYKSLLHTNLHLHKKTTYRRTHILTYENSTYTHTYIHGRTQSYICTLHIKLTSTRYFLGSSHKGVHTFTQSYRRAHNAIHKQPSAYERTEARAPHPAAWNT